MTLLEDETNSFEILINFIYTKEYALPCNDKTDTRYHHTEFIKLFCLAEKYAVDRLKKGLVSKVYQAAQIGYASPLVSQVAYLYEHTTSKSGMRKLYVD